MPYSNVRFHEDDLISPKAREALNKQKEEYLVSIDQRLRNIPDSEDKLALIAKRDHCMSKWPVFPADLSIWKVAYYEDWMRAYDRVKDGLS